MTENKDDPSNENAESLRKQLEEALAIPQKILGEIDRKIGESLDDIFARLAKVREELQRYPARIRKALRTLGERGWYPDIGRTSLEPLERGDIEATETALSHHYRQRIPEIVEDLVNWFPKRARILTVTFNAHNRGEYELSVPVFLAQADGIYHELTDGDLYKPSKRVTGKVMAKWGINRDSIEAAFLHPFEPISTSDEKQQKRSLNILNRNKVLHGASLDYATEANSLKAISLLYYVACILGDRFLSPEHN